MASACSTLCRFLVLAFVIAAIAYVAVTSGALRRLGSREQFSSDDAGAKTMDESSKLLAIYDVYRKLLGRAPLEHELSECMKTVFVAADVEIIRKAIITGDEYARAEGRRKELVGMFEKYTGREPDDADIEKVRAAAQAAGDDPAATVKAIVNVEALTVPAADDAGATPEPAPANGDKAAPPEAFGAVEAPDAEALRKRFDTYACIVRTYQAVLDRMPTTAELDKHFPQMTNDGLTPDKLRAILQSSDEFKRLYMVQKNDVFTDLPTNASEAQITAYVRDVYERVAGGAPTDSTESFLKDKYRAFELDDQRFEAYVRALVGIDAAKRVEGFDDGGDAVVPETDDRYSTYVLRRNVNELKYACNRNSMYTREESAKQNAIQGTEIASLAAHACPRQVPRPCIHDGGAFDVRPMVDQTSLIGTLLDDVETMPLGFKLPKSD